MFENKMLRTREKSMMRRFIICTLEKNIKMMKSKRFRRARHVARMGEMGRVFTALV
jgi:hypothetical protein